MDKSVVSLDKLLTSLKPCIVSIVGGGGKTSLLYALTNALATQGQTVLATTTTKMLRPPPGSCESIVLADDPGQLQPVSGGSQFSARPPSPEQDSSKVYGYQPGEVDELYRRGIADWIVVEADGAAGRPLKAPAAHEPVIPALSGIVIAILGLGCVGKAFTGDTAFRLEQMTEVTGLLPGTEITPAAIATLACHPLGMFKNTPATAKRILFANQVDLPGAEDAGAALAARCPGWLDWIVVGSLKRSGLECLSYPTMK